MVDTIIRYAAYGPALLWLWFAIAFFTAYRRTPYSEQQLLTKRLWTVVFCGFQVVYTVLFLSNPIFNYYALIKYLIVLVGTLLVISRHMRGKSQIASEG